MRSFATAGRILTSLALLAACAAMPSAAGAQEQQNSQSGQPSGGRTFSDCRTPSTTSGRT